MNSADMAAAAKNVTLASGGVAVYGGWTANEIAAVGGFIVAVIGLCVQIYYKRKSDRRDAELHAARLQWHRERDDDAP